MRVARFIGVLLTIAALATSALSTAQQKRALTARDCVTVRDLQFDESTFRSTIKISPDGSRVAYPVRSPNLTTNENEIELYVRKLPTDPDKSRKPIVIGNISAVRWLKDSRHMTALMKENGQRMLEEVDSETGSRRILVKADADIEEYSINADASIIVYATHLPPAAEESGLTPEESASGFRIPFQPTTSSTALREREQVFVTRKTQGRWSSPELITITSPLTKERLTTFVYGNVASLNPALSPDGKTLLLGYLDFSESMPDEWRTSGYMQLRNSAGVVQAFYLLILYDLRTGETRVPLKTPWVIYAPVWASDGKSFVAVALPPINSKLERENLKNHITGSEGAHLFWVELGTGEIEDVASKLAYPYEGPLYWGDDGDLIVRVRSLDAIAHYAHMKGEWREVRSWHLPVEQASHVTTDGKYVIGKFSDTMTPPQLFVYRPGEDQMQVFVKLNPQFDELTLAPPREVHWKTSSGFDASGVLLLPPNYVTGKRYPLVIHTKPFGGGFVCSAGDFPSFAPQPIANAGIMYLGPGWLVPRQSTQREQDYYPKGYPGYQGVGGVAEAAFAMDLWDSAVHALDEQGLIDPDRLGIIGFSRTGWYTEFILTHSKVQYRAATAADNVQYSLGEYWLLHDPSTIKTWDQTYGGPPYGPTLKNWLDYSISFNVDKIHTPLLMEEMGKGRPYTPAAPSILFAPSFELFTGLNRLNKPVELYYYPTEDHAPEHPKARLATMQRNVDWFRFWLKGEQDPDPAKAEQYKRWRGLRKMQEENENKATAAQH